jgi:uncharacterized protein (TIGR03118 family)
MRKKNWALRLWMLPLAVSMLIATSASVYAAPANSFAQQNLVSNVPGLAAWTDPDLVNPWGIAFSATSPIWVSDNGSGKATIYDGAGIKQGLVVGIPAPGGGAGAPTGQIFNPNSTDFGGAHFMFSTEDGTIAAWSGGTVATLPVDNSSSLAVYKGLAIANNGGTNFLYATNFRAGRVDVFDNHFNPMGSFTDASVPAGYAPFNIESVGGKLYVTFALQNAAKHDDVPGPGHGFLDVFNPDGSLVQRLVSAGSLNSPWGMALAPSSFGKLGGDLLVGNFGDGTINAFDSAGNFVGQLDDAHGNPIVNMGLWGLAFGNGAHGTSTGSLYFTAGIPGPPPGMVEDNGLFGAITPTPEAGTLTLLGGGLVSLIGYARRRGKRSV